MTMRRATRMMERGTLTIVTKSGEQYPLPAAWSLEDAGTYSFRNKLQSKAFAHGGNMVGDGKVDGRTIKVSFLLSGTTEQQHDEAVNQAYTFFSAEDYHLVAGRSDRAYHVAGLSKISHKWVKGFKQRQSEITASLLLADPFRYEAQESKVTFVFPQAVAEAEMSVYNWGSVDTPLTFRFIPSTKMANITVWHQEAKEKFSLMDALLVAPKTSVINGKDGTVWRGKENSINAFSGSFLQAKPGANLFLYTGDGGTVEITYTNRWFV